MAGVLAAGFALVHADAEAGCGGVVGGHGLDAEHDLDFVAGVEGGEGEEGGVHAAVPPGFGLALVEGKGAEHGADGFAGERGVEGSGVGVEGVGGIWVGGWCGRWFCGVGHVRYLF